MHCCAEQVILELVRKVDNSLFLRFLKAPLKNEDTTCMESQQPEAIELNVSHQAVKKFGNYEQEY